MEETKTSTTTENNTVTEVTAIQDFDYVTVVGCSNPTHFDSSNLWDVASNLYNGQDGDKAMFINQGIRQIRLYPPADGESSRRVFLIFPELYERAWLDRVREIVENDYNANYAELDSISELIDFVARRRLRKRMIKQMDFFSHGMVMTVEFGYRTGKADSYRLRDAQARMFDPRAFDEDAVIHSYACRTGLGHDIGDQLDPGEDPRYADSLAQILADSADAWVWAYPRRTLYDQTYGTKEDLRVAQETLKKMTVYEAEKRRYDAQIADYRRRTLAQGRGPLKEIPGESPPQPPIRPYTDEEVRLALHMRSRDVNKEEFGVPLDDYGAVRGVRSAESPAGLPMGKMRFTPRVWSQG
ncbi:hypothetical protein [Zestomonas carbonaria]|uniref:Uncharacterized protein n=1 Tax=Zestomonas carbonaria TaxID=2762745 RepID=A0A7U7EJN8_9GAMM|nr:hypothetical protein [Pseudomonas carbonaria]CAD5106247.1 hypothetical protein PSEWESI4_00507 [Pseudomonas carbonaria]